MSGGHNFYIWHLATSLKLSGCSGPMCEDIISLGLEAKKADGKIIFKHIFSKFSITFFHHKLKLLPLSIHPIDVSLVEVLERPPLELHGGGGEAGLRGPLLPAEGHSPRDLKLLQSALFALEMELSRFFIRLLLPD